MPPHKKKARCFRVGKWLIVIHLEPYNTREQMGGTILEKKHPFNLFLVTVAFPSIHSCDIICHYIVSDIVSQTSAEFSSNPQKNKTVKILVVINKCLVHFVSIPQDVSFTAFLQSVPDGSQFFSCTNDFNYSLVRTDNCLFYENPATYEIPG